MNNNPETNQLASLMAENQRLRDQLAMREREVPQHLADELRYFREIVHNTPLPVSVARISTAMMSYGNPAYCTLLGYNEAELLELTLPQVFAEEPDHIMSLFSQCIATGSWRGELRYRRKDGTVFPTYLTANVLYNNAGEPESVVGFVQDLTEIKRREEELRIFKLVVENAPDGIGMTDTNLRLIYANSVFAKMMALGDTWRQRLLLELIPPHEHEHVGQIAQQLIEQGAIHDQVTYLRGDGTTFTAQISALALHDEQGNLIGFASINRDITEQLQAEETLRASEQRNRVLLEAIPDIMFLINPAAEFIDCKADKSSEFYVPPESFINKRITDVLPPPLAQQILHHIELLHTTLKPQLFEYQIPLSDGIHDYEARMVQSNNDVLILARNITEQKRANQERQNLQIQIIAAQQAALRELSTPLMPIAEGVVAMPIIGTVDSNRAQQIMETLLEGIAEHNANIAILDITGVKVVDTQVAMALVRAAQAARMLGSQVVLSGISPEIAQTLVHIGAEMREMICKRSLQQGIAYALEVRR